MQPYPNPAPVLLGTKWWGNPAAAAWRGAYSTPKSLSNRPWQSGLGLHPFDSTRKVWEGEGNELWGVPRENKYRVALLPKAPSLTTPFQIYYAPTISQANLEYHNLSIRFLICNKAIPKPIYIQISILFLFTLETQTLILI